MADETRQTSRSYARKPDRIHTLIVDQGDERRLRARWEWLSMPLVACAPLVMSRPEFACVFGVRSVATIAGVWFGVGTLAGRFHLRHQYSSQGNFARSAPTDRHLPIKAIVVPCVELAISFGLYRS